MKNQLGIICGQGLKFFGKSCRLISHELKNVLAIISETAELLGELVALSAQGRDLDPAKLKSLSESILEDIERANDIVGCMNTFGHRVDEMISEVHVAQAASLAVKLIQMQAAAKKKKFVIADEGAPSVKTSAFFFQNLLFDVLNEAHPYVDSPDALHIAVKAAAAGGAVIAVSGFSPDFAKSFPAPKAQIFAELLSVDFGFETKGGKRRLEIRVPPEVSSDRFPEPLPPS